MMEKKLKPLTVGSLGLGILGEAMLTGIVTGYLVYFGTDILGVSALLIGNILLFSRVFDGVTDLGFGVIIEKTHTKAGKARPWVLWTCIPFGLFSVLVFSIPIGWNTTAKLIGLALGYNLYALAYTGLGIATASLTTLITNDSKNRLTISTISVGGAVAGNMVINAIAVSALTYFSGTTDGSFTQAAFVKLTLLLAVVSVVGGILTYINTEEMPQKEQENSKGSSGKGIKALLTNKYWLIQTGVQFTNYIALYSRLTTMVYYAQYILQDISKVTVIIMADQLPCLLAMPFTKKLCDKYGKKNCTLVGCIVSTLGLIIMILNIHNFSIFMVALIIKSIAYSPYNCSANAFIADTATYGKWKNNINVDVLSFSVSSFASKIGSGLSGSMVGYVLAFTGYVATSATQTVSAQNGIVFLFLGVSAIVGVVQTVLLFFYDLDSKMPQIVEELEQRQ